MNVFNCCYTSHTKMQSIELHADILYRVAGTEALNYGPAIGWRHIGDEFWSHIRLFGPPDPIQPDGASSGTRVQQRRKSATHHIW
jgi:hypothetical protein